MSFDLSNSGAKIRGITYSILSGGQVYRGGGIKGVMPPATIGVDKDYVDYEQIRFSLTQAWNTNYNYQLIVANKKLAQTPFRAVNNSGDLLSRKSYSCGGSCQSFQSRPGLRGLKGAFGSIKSSCDGTDIPPASCNTKYVYDSSDYVTYLKQKAINKNYNDISNGGNLNSGSQVAFRAVRRY